MIVTHLKKKDVVKSSVKGVVIEFDHDKLASILGVPGNNGICEYIKDKLQLLQKWLLKIQFNEGDEASGVDPSGGPSGYLPEAVMNKLQAEFERARANRFQADLEKAQAENARLLALLQQAQSKHKP
ncbi:hypothetical protein Dimus_024815 [Dionaea muscipula]